MPLTSSTHLWGFRHIFKSLGFWIGTLCSSSAVFLYPKYSWLQLCLHWMVLWKRRESDVAATEKCVKWKFRGELSRCTGAWYHVGLHPLAVLGTPFVDVLSGRVGAHEADGLDGRMVADEVHGYAKKTQTLLVSALGSEGFVLFKCVFEWNPSIFVRVLVYCTPCKIVALQLIIVAVHSSVEYCTIWLVATIFFPPSFQQNMAFVHLCVKCKWGQTFAQKK